MTAGFVLSAVQAADFAFENSKTPPILKSGGVSTKSHQQTINRRGFRVFRETPFDLVDGSEWNSGQIGQRFLLFDRVALEPLMKKVCRIHAAMLPLTGNKMQHHFRIAGDGNFLTYGLSCNRNDKQESAMKYAALAALFLSGCAMQPHEMASMSHYDLCDVSITSFETPRSYYAKKYARENGIDCSAQRSYADARRFQTMQGLATSAAIMNQARPPQPVIYMNPFPPPEPQTIIIQQPVMPYRIIDSSPYRYR